MNQTEINILTTEAFEEYIYRTYNIFCVINPYAYEFLVSIKDDGTVRQIASQYCDYQKFKQNENNTELQIIQKSIKDSFLTKIKNINIRMKSVQQQIEAFSDKSIINIKNECINLEAKLAKKEQQLEELKKLIK